MSHPPQADSRAKLQALQEQFRELCHLGMRGAEAIYSFRDNPEKNLETVKNSTAQLKSGLSELRKGVEESKILLKNGELIFCWEYMALQEIATNAGLTMEEIESKIKLQNGSVVNLDLSGSKTADLSPLSGLSSLQELWLNGTQVKDLSPIAGLSSLQRLGLNGTKVEDLSPLAGFSSLQSLTLWSTQVKDLSPLSGLSSLQTLVLNGTPALVSSKEIIISLKGRGVTVYM